MATDNKYTFSKRRGSVLNPQKNVPISTKKAMRAVHLLGKTIKNHFDSNVCELLTENSFDYRSYSLNVVDNLLLVGGIPRDILLGTPVRDIDITLNLRELSKIQLNHVRKYHSNAHSQGRDIRCVYWQHYLNKFDPTREEEEKMNASEKNEMVKFHECSYILNSRFMLDILEESEKFKRCEMKMTDVSELGFISVTIMNDLYHENHNLRGLSFELTDTFDPDKVLSIQKLEQAQAAANASIYKSNDNNTFLGGSIQKSRWKSLAVFPQNIDFAAEFDSEVLIVDIPIYETKIVSKLMCYDFSINTAIIPFSSITEFCDNEDEVNIQIWFWEYIVENGLDNVDAMDDVRVHRILRVANPGSETYIINVHPPTYHFWRCVELMIRLPNFYLDEALVQAHKENYGQWLDKRFFTNEIDRNKFVKRFRQIVVDYCQTVRDVRAMLWVLELLGFNNRFIQLMGDVPVLRSDMIRTVQSINDQQIMIIFQSYSYPFIIGNFTGNNNVNNANRNFGNFGGSVGQNNSNNASNNKNNEAREQQLVQKIKNLENTIESLENDKIQMAVQTNKVIDQCRDIINRLNKSNNQLK